MSAQEAQLSQNQQLADLSRYEFTGDNETVGKKLRAVEGYRLKASLYHAAQYAGCARASVYRWLESDPVFAEAMSDAFEDAGDVMETSAYEDALGSEDKPGNALLKMFWLKAHRPKYRDRVAVDTDQIQQQIEAMFSKMGITHRQLPQATDFIDTSYSQNSDEYSAVDTSHIDPVSTHFPDSPANNQKED